MYWYCDLYCLWRYVLLICKEIPHCSYQKRLFFSFDIMHIIYVSFIYGFVSTFTSSAIWALCEKGPSYFPQERWQMMASNVCKKIKAWGQYLFLRIHYKTCQGKLGKRYQRFKFTHDYIFLVHNLFNRVWWKGSPFRKFQSSSPRHLS